MVSSVHSEIGASSNPGGQPFNILRISNITQISNQEEEATVSISGRWIKINTYALYWIGVSAMIGSIVSNLAVVHSVLNNKSCNFLCIQKFLVAIGALFQFTAMSMVNKYNDQMIGICPYLSYRIIGWIGVVSGFLALTCYLSVDGFSCCRKTVYVRAPTPPDTCGNQDDCCNKPSTDCHECFY